MKITGAELVMKILLEHGVDTVFGYPGGTALFLYDELYKYSDKIKHILVAHETGSPSLPMVTQDPPARRESPFPPAVREPLTLLQVLLQHIWTVYLLCL